MKSTLKQVILDQQEVVRPAWIQRNWPEKYISSKEILVISGVRRCGKSVMVQQIRESQMEKDYFINFDDDRLINFKVEHFQDLLEVWIELYGQQNTYYFDEIQNIPGWERFVRRLYDAGNKIFVTGSNATMLSKELGTHLTGRYLQWELFPFSFAEYLDYKKVNPENYVNKKNWDKTTVKAELLAISAEYLKVGGFPQYIAEENPEYLKSLYQSILYRDVLVRNNLNNEKEMLELVYFLMSNISKPHSYNKLAARVGLKNASTAKNYVEFLENTYLVFQLAKHDFSVRKQLVNGKKVYSIDNGLSQKLGYNFTDNQGRMLENAVYLHLRRVSNSLYYYSGKRECDFLLSEKGQIIECVQVCQELTVDNQKREIAGLLEAMETYKLSTGKIITQFQEQILEIAPKKIEVLPYWKWVLS